VALLLSRLKRLCLRLGVKPSWMMSSATIHNPRELAEKLTGEPFISISNESAPRPRKQFITWKPEVQKQSQVQPGGMYEQTRHLLRDMVLAGHTVIAFTQTRLQCELLGRYLQETLKKISPELGRRIAVYRAGLTAGERREMESSLSSGKLSAVISTSALELGIDIGHLQVALIFSFPRSLASFRQQAGRAGRKGRESLVIFVPSQNPVDQYLARHPEYIFDRPLEEAFLDPDNPYLVIAHMKCAAHEYPLTEDDAKFFGPNYFPVLKILKEEGMLKEVKGKWFFPQSGSPAHTISLRSMSEDSFDLILSGPENIIIGQLDDQYFYRQIFPESIYLGGGKTYKIKGMVEDLKQIFLEEINSDYFTVPVVRSQLDWKEKLDKKSIGTGYSEYGTVTQHSFIEKLKCVQFYTGYNLGMIQVQRDLPILDTTAVLFVPSRKTWDACREREINPLTGLLGLKNLLEETIPVSTLTDRGDVQVLLEHNVRERPCIAVLDIYPGSLGLAQKVFELSQEELSFALRVVSSCSCKAGCPGCVGYDPVSFPEGKDIIPGKEAAMILLQGFLEG
jgi:DEAD/DEAH box helicase domain-containing protein